MQPLSRNRVRDSDTCTHRGVLQRGSAASLNGLTSAGFQVSLSDKEAQERPEDPLDLAATVFFGRTGNSVADRGQRSVGSRGADDPGGAGIDSATDEDCRSTWNEIAGQTMGGVAQAFDQRNRGKIFRRRKVPRTRTEQATQDEDAILEVRNGAQVWHVRIAWTVNSRRRLRRCPARVGSAGYSRGSRLRQ